MEAISARKTIQEIAAEGTERLIQIGHLTKQLQEVVRNLFSGWGRDDASH